MYNTCIIFILSDIVTNVINIIVIWPDEITIIIIIYTYTKSL